MKEKSLCLFAFFLPLEQILFHMFGVESELKPYRVFILAAFILSLFKKNFFRNRASFELKSFLFIFIYGLIVGLIRIGIGEGNLSFLINGGTHFVIGLLIFYLISNVKNHETLNKIANYFIAGLILSCLYGLYLFVFNSSNSLRLKGFYKNPNHLAFAINFLTPLLLYKVINKIKIKLNGFLIIFFSLIVLLTGSRTGLLIQVLNIIFFIIISKKSLIRMFLIFFGGGLTYFYVLLPILNINNHFMNRFDNANIETGSGRWDILDGAFNLGQDTYFMGVGIEQYRYYHVKYLPIGSYGEISEFNLSTHNHYIDLLVNFGIISLILYLIILILISKSFFKIKNRNNKNLLILLLLAFIISSFSQEMFMFPYFWITLGVLIFFKYNLIRTYE